MKTQDDPLDSIGNAKRREWAMLDAAKRSFTAHFILALHGAFWAGWLNTSQLPGAAPASTTAEVVILDPVEVTGSIIKRAEIEGPAPVKLITRSDLAESGRTSFAEFMQQLPEAGYSGINESATGAVRGANELNLRGLSSANTLTLVDGRRATFSGITNNGFAYVDQNRFPSAMIERVEILQDCGAIYGSGAAAGVVNIILRRDFSGSEVTAYYGNSPRTDVGERRLAIVSGTSNPRTSLTVGFDYVARGGLRATDMEYSRNADLSDRVAAKGERYATRVAAGAFDLRSNVSPHARIWLVGGQRNGVNGVNVPGFDLGTLINRLPGVAATIATSSTNAVTPNFTTPAVVGTQGRFDAAAAATFVPQLITPRSISPNMYNSAEGTWLSPRVERTGVNLAWQRKLSPQATAYARLAAQHNWNYIEMTPISVTSTIPRTNYWNPFGVDVAFSWLANEVGPRTSSVTDRSLAGVLGARGVVRGRWQWDSAFTYGYSQNTEIMGNMISRVGLRDALALTTPDALNLFGGAGFRNQPGTLGLLRLPQDWQGRSEQWTWDARLSGDLMALPAGMLSGGAYCEARHEEFFEHNMTTNSADATNGFAWNAVPGRRTVGAGVAEVHAPLLKRGSGRLVPGADLSAAARFDAYSDGYDSGLKPYFGLRVQPAPWLTLRTSYARTFLSPTLQQLYGQSTDMYQAALPDLRRPQALTNDPFDGTSTQRLVRGEGNRNLQPASATSWQYGVVCDLPGRWWRGLTVSATYFHLEQVGAVTSLGTTLIRQNEVGGGTADLIVREPASETYTNRTGSPINVLSGPDGATTAVLTGQSVTVPGRIAYISNSFVNLGLRRTSGCDISIQYSRTFEPIGRLRFISALTYAGYLGSALRPALITNLAGREPYPRLRRQSSLSWSRGAWSAAVANQYVGPYGDINRGNRLEVDAYSTYDIRVSRTFPRGGSGWLAGTRFTLGTINVFDRDPPLDYSAVSYSRGNVRRPAGRFLYVEIQRSH